MPMPKYKTKCYLCKKYKFIGRGYKICRDCALGIKASNQKEREDNVKTFMKKM